MIDVTDDVTPDDDILLNTKYAFNYNYLGRINAALDNITYA